MRESNETNRHLNSFSRNRRRATIWFASAVLAITFYVGSIGPAFLLTGFQLNRIETATRTQRACEILYLPIYRVCRESRTVRSTVGGYLSLWAFRHRSPATGPTASTAISRGAGEQPNLPH